MLLLLLLCAGEGMDGLPRPVPKLGDGTAQPEDTMYCMVSVYRDAKRVLKCRANSGIAFANAWNESSRGDVAELVQQLMGNAERLLSCGAEELAKWAGGGTPTIPDRAVACVDHI